MNPVTISRSAWDVDEKHDNRVFVTTSYSYNANKVSPMMANYLAAKKVKSVDGNSNPNVLENFLGTTTISALNQVKSSSNTIVKIIWMGLFAIGLTMSIYQTVLLMKNFLRFSVVEKPNNELQYPVEFPSITVCSNLNIYISDEVLQNPIAQECLKDFIKEHEGNASAAQPEDVFFVISQCSLEARKLLSVPVKDFVLVCEYIDSDCRDSLIVTHSLQYGSCATFNPHKMPIKTDDKNVKKVFRMLLYTYDTVHYVDLNHERSVMTLIHPADTAPVMDETRLIQMLPGDWWELSVSKHAYIRKSWPFETQCIESNSPEAQWMSLYYSEETPYLYTMEACTDSCLQNLSLKYCNCYMPEIPIQKLTSDSEDCSACSVIPKQDLLDICGCRKACVSSDYNVHQVRNPYKFKEVLFQKSFLKGKNDDDPRTSSSFTTGFSLEIMSNFVSITKEEPETDVSSLLGSIGGVFGLWIGFSLMSVFEVLNALGSFVLLLCKKVVKCQ